MKICRSCRRWLADRSAPSARGIGVGSWGLGIAMHYKAASGLRSSHSPLLTLGAGQSCERALPLALPAADARRWSRLRAGSAPRAPRWGRSAPPNPLQSDVSSKMEASVHAFGMPKCMYAVACAHLPVSMRAKCLAYRCIESGIQGTQSLAGGAGGAAAPGRPPRRRTAKQMCTSFLASTEAWASDMRRAMASDRETKRCAPHSRAMLCIKPCQRRPIASGSEYRPCLQSRGHSRRPW